jgi:alanine-synthesizing transaminase
VEFRRINGLPPYVFAIINELRDDARRAGRDVIDMGFGNPDIPSPGAAVEKLAEAVRNPRNHRYSASRGSASSGWSSTRTARWSRPSAPRRASPT